MKPRPILRAEAGRQLRNVARRLAIPANWCRCSSCAELNLERMSRASAAITTIANRLSAPKARKQAR